MVRKSHRNGEGKGGRGRDGGGGKEGEGRRGREGGGGSKILITDMVN